VCAPAIFVAPGVTEDAIVTISAALDEAAALADALCRRGKRA
jgi:hypothetical protein